MSDLKLKVIIRETEGILWEGSAHSFSSTNDVGNFDILPEHAHYVGSIKEFITIRINGKEKKFEIETGVMSAVDGIVEVFLGY